MFQGEPAQSATATVDVAVTDINDSPPVFTRIFTSQLAENVKLGSEVLKITTTDLDVGVNAMHTYAFLHPVEAFSIEPATGIIRVAAGLDREQSAHYELEVRARDGAFSPTTRWDVEVLDINDNAPQFESAQYAFDVAEQQPVGALIGQLSASDADSPGANSDVFYYLKEPSSDVSVNASSGALLVRQPLRYDAEVLTDNQLELLVVASDRGDPVLTSAVSVLVNVKPANNHAPVFDESIFNISVAENSAINFVVATLHAR